jgi:type I site-specific restriction endonuclease
LLESSNFISLLLGQAFMPTEADTCRRFVVPKLQAAGWDNEPHSIAEQRTITDGRVVPVGKGFIRKPPKRVDYLLRYARDFPLAVVEAKAAYKTAADAVQQARSYAEMLGLKFAYATTARTSSKSTTSPARKRMSAATQRHPSFGSVTSPVEDWPRTASATAFSPHASSQYR